MATSYKWQFAPRFRRNVFGWKSDTPIQRIKEAVTEIKAVAKKEPLLAARQTRGRSYAQHGTMRRSGPSLLWRPV